MFSFLTDRVIKGRMYPALTSWQARPYTQSWREFGTQWPWTIPVRLQEYCDQHGYPLDVCIDAVDPVFYPIGLGFFDFAIDYLDLLPDTVKTQLHQGTVKLLFYYHEGDNPVWIKHRLDNLCLAHGFRTASYVFVSANSAANDLDNFVEFVDFELWYYQRNLAQPPLPIHQRPRSQDFTVLSRLHKSWRAVVMADLWRAGILDRSHWSYCEPVLPDDDDCAIEIDSIAGLRTARQAFAHSVPHYCDHHDQATRNDHAVTPQHLHQDSWFNIIVETHFDVDGSGGVFLTEKTFKPIKHGQPFFVAGAAGSLAKLRELGYRTFDTVLDNSYDQEPDPTQRWIKLKQAILCAQQQGVERLFADCVLDVEHNQNTFVRSKHDRLNTLAEKINSCL